ncbi:GNAT family N-acetyltransferase [Agrococcus versicolor]|uniref:GNAT family N-acetyltransferase n=1 Tax=Agrococcus versicolor TaxID=501482 RepID=A0ABN3AMU1_9MICO
MTIEIHPIEMPTTATEPGERGDAFREHHALAERSAAARYAPGVLDLTADERLTAWATTATERNVRLGARLDGRLVGAAHLWLPLAESTDVLDFGTAAEPGLDASTARAVHAALVERALAVAGTERRRTIMGGSPGAATGDRTAATGFGAADPGHPEAAPLVAAGFELEQVYRVSLLHLDAVHDLRARLEAASARSRGYDVVAWQGETPGVHREAMRRLHERMSTDAPVGGLALEPEVWSDERLAAFEQQKAEGGRTIRTVAARDASGTLVGFSTLFVGSGDVARQHDTLVVREHRGHGLGMLLKLANLVELDGHHPGHRRVSTWNAEENRPMLATNEAVGFAPIAYEAVWQRTPRDERTAA